MTERSGASFQAISPADPVPPLTARARAVLDAAEELFCARGFAGVSMRDIATASGQHLSTPNYYFGSKAGLFEAVFVRRIVPVNRRRLALLQEYQAIGRVTVDDVVDAYIRPLFADDEDGTGGANGTHARLIMMFSKQLLSNPDEHRYLQERYEDVARAFIAAIGHALPTASIVEVTWGYNYMIGILIFTLAGRAMTARMPDDVLAQLHADESAEQTIRRLVRFIRAGIVAIGKKSFAAADR